MTTTTPVVNTVTCEVCKTIRHEKSYQRHSKLIEQFREIGGLMKTKCDTCNFEILQNRNGVHLKFNKLL